VDFPVSPKEHGTQFLFEQRHLWLRSRRQVAIARVRHEVVQSIRDFFYQRDFVLVDTPILTGAIGEEAGNLFSTDYFDLGKAYLAQTGQLYVEAAAAALGGCTASVPPSAPRSQRPGDTSPSSGWSSRKWRSMTRTTTCACRKSS
jgi:aspartyl/asparaginyl-tRNA synthetase